MYYSLTEPLAAPVTTLTSLSADTTTSTASIYSEWKKYNDAPYPSTKPALQTSGAIPKTTGNVSQDYYYSPTHIAILALSGAILLLLVGLMLYFTLRSKRKNQKQLRDSGSTQGLGVWTHRCNTGNSEHARLHEVLSPPVLKRNGALKITDITPRNPYNINERLEESQRLGARTIQRASRVSSVARLFGFERQKPRFSLDSPCPSQEFLIGHSRGSSMRSGGQGGAPAGLFTIPPPVLEKSTWLEEGRGWETQSFDGKH